MSCEVHHHIIKQQQQLLLLVQCCYRQGSYHEQAIAA